jgi:hypothetical protein
LHCTNSPESLEPSAAEENVNLDIEDQTNERRYFRDSHGQCHVNPYITKDGIFWIKPICNHPMKRLSDTIGDFITKTQWKSYSELHIVPEVGKKCFVKHERDWCRGLIEKVHEDACIIRNLDSGNGKQYSLENVYPHRRLTHSSSSETNMNFQIPKYLGIRCAISRESVRLNHK